MNKQFSLIVFLILVCSFVLMGCTAGVIAGLYGMKKMKQIDEKTIVRYSKKYAIPVSDSYELDTSYFSFLLSCDTSVHKKQIKNHYQPLQALYFDKSRKLTSFQINCYAGGFPNLDWNRNEIMSTFPPKQQAPPDSILSFEKQLSFLRPLTTTEHLSTDNIDYIIVVYWSKFMNRQSRRLIRFVQQNSKLSNDRQVKIIYANTDNVFAK
jgi:hypothetical protein